MSTADTKEEDDKADVNSPTGSATNTMLIPEKGDVKMAGYLEKRGKMKLISTWKRYWFVLEGRLLLYYRSQLEYLNLSACRGSLNMGIASCVRPVSGPGFVMEVVTRTHVITLRTKDRAVQEQWLQALLDSMALPNISSPMRNNGGPLHFRYSMDNLPTTDEMEQHDKEIRDKQGTLPRQPRPPSRQECVLNRIKHLGGHSYGASLDAILNRQSTNQIQQPKIPRIKAVDRMLELQARDIEQDPSYTEGSENNVTPPNKKENEIKSDKPKTMPELGSDEQNSPQIAVGQGESPLREKLEGSHSNEIQITEMKVQASSMKEIAEKTSSDYVPSVLSSSLTETSNMNMNYESALEVSRSNDVKEDIVKDKDTEQSSNITPQYVEVENQLYIESSQKSAGGKSCESTDGVTRKTKSVADTISKGIEISADEDDEYYSNYDKALVMQNDENISEPILPPRPSVSSPDSHDEVEYVEYNKYYEPEIQSEPLSPCTEEEKKKKKLRLRREKSLKDLITSENRSNHKNRKMSFLRKMLKHYRKKAEHTQEGDDEPEYDTVDYSSVCPGSKDERSTDCRQEEELSQRKSIGTAALLTKCALEELQLKLKEREHGSTKQVTDDKVFDEMEKITSSNSLAEERSSMKDCKDLDSRNDVLPSDIEERPQLPPRRTRRPSSPWHDIPTNNSPVYGNFNFHSISSSENKCNEDNSVWSQEMQDELLGTPQGYSYLQNKWKAAEGSVEWHRELRQVAFPVNTRNQGPKLLNTNDSEHVVHHDHSDGNVFKTESSFRNNEEDSVRVDSAEIYSKIDKKLGEITNNSTQEKNEVGSKEFCEQGVKNVKQTEQKSSEVCVVENMNYIPCCNLNSNNITLLTLQVETSQDEHFQKDSLMTSLCTQAESELDDSIISINPSVSKRTNSELDHENIIVLSKDQNYFGGMKDGNVHSECECDNKITSDEIPSIKKMETESNPGIVLREGTKEVTNRYSDELNLLLAQLAEITSAPLLSPGATKSLIDFPESKTSHFHDLSFSDQITLLGPIRRRRHSEPDYDIPRPHNSLIQIKSFPTAPMHLPYASIYQDKNLIETTQFLEPSLPEEPSETSSVMKDTDQTQLSWTLSMAPDSLEPIPVKYLETINKPTS
ncbi:uncharacterized protein [Anabrus simplex]|uniref:uncharacterized protein n=1 Tax=Anabrus simplex TaxID=316456 RepID=UPI0035A32096